MEPASANVEAASESRGWARVFASIYDAGFAVGEWAGMRAMRKQLLAQARGRTLEIGSGTGLNLAHYPDRIDELILTEPEPAMRERLQRKLRAGGRHAQLLDAGAERLPVADASLDTVVCTLVLCTVDSPQAALAEVARALKPDGQLLLIEHVRAHSPALARWQDRLEAPWRRFAVGCRCNRDTAALIGAAGFELDARESSWRLMPPLVRPLIAGTARLARVSP
jgi:ubiquinone/menaquinone biosynthesis C-methylase UbiE